MKVLFVISWSVEYISACTDSCGLSISLTSMNYNDHSSGQILIMYSMFIVLDTVEVSDRFARSDTKFRTLINVLRLKLLASKYCSTYTQISSTID